MPETLKNRDAFPIGTRVKLAFHKIDINYGTVHSYSQDGRMNVHWDGQLTPIGPYQNFELKAVEKKNFIVTMRDYKISFSETYSAINAQDAINQSIDQYPTSRFVSCEEEENDG